MNFNEKWINLLTEDNVDKQQEFEEMLATSKSVPLAIMKFRRLRMSEGRDITVEELLKANSEEFVNLLQELFLEPIEFGHIEFLHKEIDRKRIKVEDALSTVINKHNKNKGSRFLSIALTL